MKLLGWFFFFFLGWIWVCGMGFSLYFVVSSIDGWFGCVNSPFARILQKIWKKKRLWLLQRCFKPTMFLKKWRGWEEERGREKVVFLLFCWCVGLGLAGIKHNFYTSSWPNLISCNKHPNLSLCLLIICSVLRKRDIVEIIDNLVLTI